MQSFGLTLVYLGFGGLLVLSLTARGPAESTAGLNVACGKIGSVLAFLGTYSYSIYLWHLPVEVFGLRGVQALSPVKLGAASLTFIYIAISIPVGILMAQIVEFPALQLRDRLFPRTRGSVVPNRTEALDGSELALTQTSLT